MDVNDGGLAGSVGRRRPGRGKAAPAMPPPHQPARDDARAVEAITSTLDELLSTLSHELRGPLTTIKGSSRTLLRHGARLDADTTRQLLTDIDSEADRLHRLVDNLLDL